jgi:bacterial/archaeal transporter family-2 protein
MYPALLAVALLVGCLLAVQASVNLQLNAAVKTPYGASTVQLAVAAVVLAIVATAAGGIGAVALVPDVPWWQLLGGLASPLYITSGILLFPRLGALASVGLFVTGQVLASLVLDLTGLLDVPRRPLTAGIVLGAAAALLGVTLIVRQQRVNLPALRNAGWIALGLVAGAVLPVQGAINARLRAGIQAPLTVGMISFTVATATIAVVLVVLLALRRTPAPQFGALPTMPWWGWLGGLCAATYVTAVFLLIPEIGASATVALTVTGQQLFSAVIDSFGLFRMPKRTLNSRRLGGLALLIAGSTLVQLT